MAVYKIFPEKDATIYSAYPAKNTGLDPILDVSTTNIPDNPQVSRFLVKFSSTEISNVIDDIISGSVTDATGSLLTESKDFQANLKCFIADVSGLSNNNTLEVFPIAEDWNMGTGKYNNEPQVINGVGWTYRASSGSNAWTTSGFDSNITGSSPVDNPGGGAWYHGTIGDLSVNSSQSLNYSDDKDINVNVTNAIRLIDSGTINNEGFIVKQSSTTEFSSDRSTSARIQYFSVDTHTIYPPLLEFKWRDWVYANTSSYFVPSGSAEEIAAGS